MAANPVNLWTSADHARDYLERADSISHRSEGESALLEFVPEDASRILDLGTGDGRLLSLVKKHLAGRGRQPEAIAVDFSPSMLEAARQRFAGDSSVTVMAHNLDEPLPDLGKFDAVVSSSLSIISFTTASARFMRKSLRCSMQAACFAISNT